MPLLAGHPEGLSAGATRRTRALRRPLLGLAASFIAGLLLAPLWTGPWPWLLAAPFFFVLASMPLRKAGPAQFLLHLAVVLTAMAWRQFQEKPWSAREISRILMRGQEHLSLMGVVYDDPELTRSADGDLEWRFPLRLEAVNRIGSWQQAAGRAEIRWAPGGDQLGVTGVVGARPLYGERWVVQGVARLQPPRPGQRPVVAVRVRETAARCIGRAAGWDVRSLCLRARRASAERLSLGVARDVDAVGMMQAFMLGYRETLPDRAHRAFSRTGTLHIAAISGAHVVILAGLLLIPLKALGVPQTRWILVMGPLLLLYALATGLAASAVRACIMASVYWSAFAFRRRPDGPSALALSALLILIVDPGQLWEPGFLLSFGVVAGLMLLVPSMAEPLLARLQPDHVRHELPFYRLRRLLLRPVIAVGSVTLAAWLASLPMTAQFFHLFSPVGLVANLLVVPLASLILLNGCLALTVGWLSPVVAEVFNHGSRVLVQLLLWLVEFFQGWPGGHCFVKAPALAWTVAWYGWLVVMAVGTRRTRWVALALACVLGTSVWIHYRAYARPVMSLSSAGRGLRVLVEQPGHDPVLINPGPAYGGRAALRWLRSRGVDRLRAVVLTRASADCSGALPSVLDEIPVQEVWIPASPSRSKSFDADVAYVRGKSLAVIERVLPDEGAWGIWYWQVLHPTPTNRYLRAADGGLVIRWSSGPASVLVADSASLFLQDEVVARPFDLAAEGLVVTRWRPDASWSEAWLAAVRPRKMIRPALSADPSQPAEDATIQDGQSVVWSLHPRASPDAPLISSSVE